MRFGKLNEPTDTFATVLPGLIFDVVIFWGSWWLDLIAVLKIDDAGVLATQRAPPPPPSPPGRVAPRGPVTLVAFVFPRSCADNCRFYSSPPSSWLHPIRRVQSWKPAEGGDHLCCEKGLCVIFLIRKTKNMELRIACFSSQKRIHKNR